MESIVVNNLIPTFRDEIMTKFKTDKNPLDLTNCLTCGMCSSGCPFNGVYG